MFKVIFVRMEKDAFKKSWIQTLHREEFNKSVNIERRKRFGQGGEETSKTIAFGAERETELY